MRKLIYVLGGGTFSHVRCHLATSTPAFGETARTLTRRLTDQLSAFNLEDKYEVRLSLTKMADPINSDLVTNEDVDTNLNDLLDDFNTKVIIFNIALCDYDGQIGNIPSDKYADRLQSRNAPFTMTLSPKEKLIARVKQERPDIILVGFKTTSGDSANIQEQKGLRQIEETGADIVFVNDTVTRENQIVTTNSPYRRVISERKSALRILTAEIIKLIKNA